MVRPAAVDSHRPERTGRWEPVDLMSELTRPVMRVSRDGDGRTEPDHPALVLRLWPRPQPLDVRIENGRVLLASSKPYGKVFVLDHATGKLLDTIEWYHFTAEPNKMKALVKSLEAKVARSEKAHRDKLDDIATRIAGLEKERDELRDSHEAERAKFLKWIAALKKRIEAGK